MSFGIREKRRERQCDIKRISKKCHSTYEKAQYAGKCSPKNELVIHMVECLYLIGFAIA